MAASNSLAFPPPNPEPIPGADDSIRPILVPTVEKPLDVRMSAAAAALREQGPASAPTVADGGVGTAGTPAGAGVDKRPTVCIVIGMAGSGKTVLVQRINAHVHQHNVPSYIINLDPAVRKVPYGANIDIRDTVDYKEVMKQYKLGPNGGILTSLNLFATRFDKVMEFVDAKADALKYVLRV